MKHEIGEVLVLIPARGGSKSVPRKNIVPLLGKPLIAYSIEVALACQYVNRVIVSTDDKEIASISRQYGADIPFFRPYELAEDESLDIDYHRHALEWLQKHENYTPDMVMNLRPTAPSRKASTLDAAILRFSEHPDADSLRSVRLASETPFKMWLKQEDGCLAPAMHLEGIEEPYNMPRQKLPLVYWQDGYVDITRPATILSLTQQPVSESYRF